MKNQFRKVSYEQYAKDFAKAIEVERDDEFIKTVYDEVKLPTRATAGSAGYDFFAPFYFSLGVGESMIVPTGIKVELKDNRFLLLAPRSGLGFKFRIQLDNTVGIIDSDYINSDNEGHIFAKITNDGKEGKRVLFRAGEAFMQGIICFFDVTEDDEVDRLRNGGFGSTTG